MVNLLNNLDQSKLQEFIYHNNSDYKINIDTHSIQFDYSWIDKIEETIQYLDVIIRIPKKFLAQEEEVVPIAKAKKISMETIRHLAQHTNLIQEVDRDGTIKPSSVLNIHREETFDLYENRFIYSLLINLHDFVQRRKDAVKEGSFSKSYKKLNFNTQTIINSEQINVNIGLEASSDENLAKANPNGLDVNQRIERIELIIMDYMKSPFIKSLVGVTLVRSPIRRTNIILKNTNFKKALELWEFIEKYDFEDRKELKQNLVIDSNKEVENKYLMTSFLNYNILNNLSSPSDDNNENEDKIKDYYLNKAIQDFLKENKDIDMVDFRQILAKTFTLYKQKKIKMQKHIYNELSKYMKRHNTIMKKMIQTIRIG